MRKTIGVAASTIMVTLLWAAPVGAMNKFLEQGIQEFNKGHYSEAIGLFGEAKPTESDNPILHYYMANALIKMNLKSNAIREYKMAMALQPTGKLADYCLAALRSLGAAPLATPPAQTAEPGKTTPAGPRMKEDIPNVQQPQVISIVDDSPRSYRVDMIVTNLQALYGDIIAFRRTMQNSPDEKTKELLNRYNAGNVPTIILVSDQGQAIMQFSGDIVEDNVRKQVEELARTSRWREPGVSQDPHLVEYRHQVLSELEARIAEDQLRVDHEIKVIKDTKEEQLNDARRSGGYGRGEEMERLEREAENKIQAIRADFEKRKSEWRAAAQAKIGARTH